MVVGVDRLSGMYNIKTSAVEFQAGSCPPWQSKEKPVHAPVLEAIDDYYNTLYLEGTVPEKARAELEKLRTRDGWSFRQAAGSKGLVLDF